MHLRLLSMYLASLQAKLIQHGRLVSLVGGSLIVSVWTVLRQVTNGTNFDVVGQVGLAQQWSQGFHSGAQLGVTNYVLKIPFYMAINTLEFISPVHRLFILALAFNLLTFLLLFVLFERILNLYGIRRKDWLYLAMFWLATIAGNVFWMDYANSRNLETVGGVLLLYLLLRLLKGPGIMNAMLVVTLGSITYFADSLQLYTSGLGVCIYVITRWLCTRDKSSLRLAGVVVGAVALAAIGARAVRAISGHLLGVSYLQTPHQPYAYDLHTVAAIFKTLCTNSLSIFGADFAHRPVNANSVREVLGAIVLFGMITYVVRYWHRIRNIELFWVLVTIIATNYVVYIASGQVLVWATARYLIMVPLFSVLLVSLAGDRASHIRANHAVQLGWFVVSICSAMLITGALAINWPNRQDKNTYIYRTVHYMHNLNFTYALASREIGITTTYFSEGKATVLPMLCTPEHRLVASDLFYDRANFERFASFRGFVPIILSGGSINTDTNSCSEADISQQYGLPREVTSTADGTIAMIYDSKTIANRLVTQ